MKRLIVYGLVIAALVFISGCGGGSTTPTPPTPTVTSIIVTSASTMLKVGQTETFTAMVNMSDGTQRAATGTWSSDNTGVATVISSGLVTIVGAGNTNIIMSQGGKTGQKAIRGVPDYQGTWGPGTYRLDSCTNTGDFATQGFCSYYPIGQLFPITLTMTQTTDTVNCSVLLVGLAFTAAPSTIATNGQLSLVGSITSSINSINVTMVLQQAVPGQLTGTLVQLWTDTTMIGYGQYNCSIYSLSKTSPEPDEAAIYRMAPPKGATLGDLLRALGIR